MLNSIAWDLLLLMVVYMLWLAPNELPMLLQLDEAPISQLGLAHRACMDPCSEPLDRGQGDAPAT